MAQWQRHLELQPEWDKASEGEISFRELAGVIARRLKDVTPFGIEVIDKMKDDIIFSFEDIVNDPYLLVNDFDDTVNDLYDWADTPLTNERGLGYLKVCWVNTSSSNDRI